MGSQVLSTKIGTGTISYHKYLQEIYSWVRISKSFVFTSIYTAYNIFNAFHLYDHNLHCNIEVKLNVFISL